MPLLLLLLSHQAPGGGIIRVSGDRTHEKTTCFCLILDQSCGILVPVKPPFQLFSPKCQSSHMLLFSEHNPVGCGTLAPPSSSWNHLLGLLPFLPSQRNGFWSRFSVDAPLQHNVSDFKPQVRSGAVSRVMGISRRETGSCCSCPGKHKCLMGFFSISCSSLAKFDQIRLTNAIICGRQHGINANRHLDTSGKHFIGVQNPAELLNRCGAIHVVHWYLHQNRSGLSTMTSGR